MKNWAKIAGFEYGSVGYKQAPKTVWDADSWYECLCSANTPAGFLGHTGYPTIGPRAMIEVSNSAALHIFSFICLR